MSVFEFGVSKNHIQFLKTKNGLMNNVFEGGVLPSIGFFFIDFDLKIVFNLIGFNKNGLKKFKTVVGFKLNLLKQHLQSGYFFLIIFIQIILEKQLFHLFHDS